MTSDPQKQNDSHLNLGKKDCKLWQRVRNFFSNYPIFIIPTVTLLFIIIPVSIDLFVELVKTWKVIPSPPAKPQKLLGAAGIEMDYRVFMYLLTEDGRIYSTEKPPFNWTLVSEEEWSQEYGLMYHVERYSRNCDLSTLKFQPWKKPFSNSFECAEGTGLGDSLLPVSLAHYTFVVDQDGTIWYWETKPEQYVLCIPRFWVCATAGLLFGFLIFIRKYRKKKPIYTLIWKDTVLGKVEYSGNDFPWMFGRFIPMEMPPIFNDLFKYLTSDDNSEQDPPFDADLLDDENWLLRSEDEKDIEICIPAVYLDEAEIMWRLRGLNIDS